MPTITIEEIKTLIPIDGEISDYLLESYSDIVTDKADLQLRNIFANPLPVVSEADCYNYKTYNTYGNRFISITAWQPTGLIIKKIDEDQSENTTLTETPLVFGTDYVFWYGKTGDKIPGIIQPVTKIKLINNYLYNHQKLRLSGTYGWQVGYPNDVKVVLAQAIVDLALWVQDIALSGGSNLATRIKEENVEKEIDLKIIESSKSEAENILSGDSVQKVFNSYLMAGQENISTIC